MRYKAPEFVIDLAWLLGCMAVVYGVSLVSEPAMYVVIGVIILAHVFVVANGRERRVNSSSGRPIP